MGRAWRFLASYGLDVVLVGAAVQSAVGTTMRHDADRPDGARLWIEAAAVAAAVLVLVGRRWFPCAAPLVTWVGSAALSLADPRAIPTQAGIFVAGMGAALLLGLLRSNVQARAGLVVVLLSAALIVHQDPAHRAGDIAFTPIVFAVAWLAGFALRERAERTEEAEERAQRAEREREAASRVAVAEERSRMARELHDVVAHAMSVMVLQVGAVRHRIPATSQESEALRNVEHAGRTALAEMRRLLGALREGNDTLDLTPHPGLDDLDALADDVRAAGLDVRLHRKGDPVSLPRALDLSAYRIVQEGLTNALRHSGAGRVDVTVDYASDRVRLEVRDDGPGGFATGDGLGHGLIGIGERVKIHGGDMSTVASPSGFVLRASLPLEIDSEES